MMAVCTQNGCPQGPEVFACGDSEHSCLYRFIQELRTFPFVLRVPSVRISTSYFASFHFTFDRISQLFDHLPIACVSNF